jgi:predicted transcriptional regulator
MAQMKKAAAKPVVKKAAPSTIQQIAKRLGITAREVRDIATAIGAPKTIPGKSITRVTYAGDEGKKQVYKQPTIKSNKASGVKAQAKEALAALTTGQKGTSVGHISASGKVKSRKQR